MDHRRAYRFLIIGPLVLAGIAAVRSVRPDAHLDLGDESPAEFLPLGPGRVAIAWVLGPEDLFGCVPGINSVREVQRKLVDSVEIVVVVVNDPDRAAAMLRFERIRARLEHHSRRGVRALVGSEPLPALVLIADGYVAGIWSKDRAETSPSLGSDANSFVEAVSRAAIGASSTRDGV